MWQQLKYRNPFFISLLFHVIILTILIVSFEFSSRPFVLENSDNNSNIVNATMVSESTIQMPEPTPLPPPSKPTAPKKILPLQPKAKPPVKVPPQVKKMIEPPVKQKTIAIPDRHKKLQQDDVIQKQLLADLKKQTKQKMKHKELEKAFAKELQAQTAKSLEQQLLSETNRLSSAEASKMQGIVDKYKALILQAIAQHWLVPNGVDKKLSSELLIRVAAGGTVLDVQIVKSSGDDALDRSARSAVFKASPLPVPTKAEELEPFRQFILKVKPENILARDNGLS